MAVVQDSNLISLLIYSAYNFSNRILSIHIQLHVIIIMFADNVKEQFISAVRKFMQMETLTAPLLKELIDKIVVYETQGTGKYRTQRIVIYYRFVGYLEIPLTESEWEYYRADTRQGVAVEYISKNIPA